MKALIIFIFTFSAFASDKVIQELQNENEVLKKKIKANNSLIQMRKENNSLAENTLTKNKSLKKKQNSQTTTQIFIGAEELNWGDDYRGSAPTIGFGINFKNNIGLFGSVGRLLIENQPAVGTQTLVGVFTAGMKYNYQTPINGLSINPLVGYVYYGVDSPDAGNTDNSAEAENELDEIQAIRDRSDIFAGFEIAQEISDSWAVSLRADVTKSGSLFLNKTF